MNKLKNYVFTDPYEPVIDIDMGSPFRTALKSDAMFSICPYDPALGHEVGPVSVIRKTISKLTGTGELRNYVILTKRPCVFAEEFISNNVIDVTGKSDAQVANDVDWVFSGFGREKDDPFIIGDNHFWHRNIIKYCNRPWNSGFDTNGNIIVTDEDVIKMNEEMINRWNLVVGKNDIVYSLGDFCFGNKEKIQSIFDKLNGRKYIVLGNHDKLKFKQYYDIGFERVYDHPIILHSFLILSHQPLEWVSNNGVYGNIYAHVHNSKVYKDFTENTFCVSAERIDYTPIRLSEIIKRCQSSNSISSISK